MLDTKELISEVNELIEELCGDREDNISIEKKISEEGLKALKEALSILSKYKEDFPEDLLGATKILGKYASYGYGKYAVKKSGSWPSITNELVLENVGLEKSDDDGGKKFPSLSRLLNPVSEE